MSRLSPYTHAQQHTRTSRTFYIFAICLATTTHYLPLQREEEAEDPAYRFPSIQEKYHAGITTTTREEIEQMIGAELPEQQQAPSTSQAMGPRPEGLIPSVIKTELGEDVKPTLRMTVPSQRRLLQWQGTGNKELIITKVTKGNDPLENSTTMLKPHRKSSK